MTASFPRIEAPDRTVCALTGTTEVEQLRADLAKAIEDRDGFKVELDNAMQHNIDLARLVTGYAVSEGMWQSARDEAVEKFDEACEQRDEAYTRIDELQAELDDVRGEKKWGES